ncbi:MAG: transglycosylase domain-containing protein [Candidatus Harrisonbacteria bacterium]|nr:transglycosylase domain-containing protein [Candidatus Harrisonbacteria bacterium]
MTKRRKRLNLFTLLILSALGLIALGLTALAVILKDLPNPEQFASRQIIQSTKIFDRTGQVLLYEIHGEEKRTAIAFEEIPDYVKWATIAIEENNFYSNPAFDLKGIVRAFLANILSGEFSQGGSTITQQLARNAFLTPEKTIIRKIKELIVALELEKQYSKNEVLNLYLNQIPYGGNAYGIEAAAQTFFNKHAKNLNLAESALLASLPRATSYYSPWGKHLDELMKRKNLALEKMSELKYITEKEKEAAKKFPLEFASQVIGIKAPHFVLGVQDYLNQKYGEDFIRTAGLNVITTLDWNLQQLAEKTVKAGADRNTELYEGHNAALVAQHATSGQIVALVGSKDYFGDPEPENCAPGKDCHFEGNFNVATQGLRQPGSAMKPLTYVTAFQKGYSPDTVVFDLPTEFAANNPDCPLEVEFKKEETSKPDENQCFHPENFDGKFRGPVKLRTALAQSINVPASKVLYLAGIDNTLKTAAAFGITTLTERSRYGLSLVLGGGEITLKELVGAYSVFAQEGKWHPQTLILKITDSNGQLVEEYKEQSKEIIAPQYPRLINDILTDLEERAGLFSSSLSLTIFPGHQVALKTGTTNDYRDAWAIGYTPDLVVGVWAGNNDNIPMQQRGSSILAAVPIWSAFLKEALANKPLVSFNKPEPVLNQKAALRGEYITNYKVGDKIFPHLHEILYYVNKNDPLGPAPADPGKDPQFENWEVPVLRWAEKNIPNFLSNYNQPVPDSAKTESEINSLKSGLDLLSPKNGDFIKNPEIAVSAKLESQFEIKDVQLFFNNELADRRSGNFGQLFNYQFSLIPKKLELQNSLRIKFTDSFNNEIVKEIILFK